MKRFIVSFTVGIITILTMLCGAMYTSAMGFYECGISIYITNAPEGTAFADILFKKVEDDKYAPAAEPSDNGKTAVCHTVRIDSGDIELDEHCGLAEYDDGFTSCMMRRHIAVENRVFTEGCELNWDMPSAYFNSDIFEYYGEFKVAYCDRDGNVLLVTDPVKVRGSHSVYEVCADGAKAKCRGEKAITVYTSFAASVSGIAVAALLAAALVGAILLPFGNKTAPEKRKKKALLVLTAMGITALTVGALCTVFMRFVFY